MATLITSGHGEGLSPEHGAGQVHHPPASLYYKIYFVLMGLLVATVAAYGFDVNKILGLNWPNLVIALIIAVTKAAFVVLFFMNVRGSTRLTWLWAAIGFIWLLLMGGIFLDYQSRAWVDLKGWQ
ncbi:MAG: cytochrome C oxidase subunit IV family protein [Cytophagales bacterium]|nr:cytochrome C oxidase subunit IV family protein [Armatimonadota bacterium]